MPQPDPIPSLRRSQWQRFRRIMRWMALVSIMTAAAAVYFVTQGESETKIHMLIATALGAGLSVLLGAALMSSASGAGTSSLPSLVKDAATTSQVLQPPIDFAPGWRLILLVVLSLLASAACSLALSLDRPRLAVAVPSVDCTCGF